MAVQLSAVGAQIVLHQEVQGRKLLELLRRCGLTPVEAAWSCPISYDANVVVPVYKARFMLSSAPNTFLRPGQCTCGFDQWISACRCFGDEHWRAGIASLAAFRFVSSPNEVDLVTISTHLTNRNPAIRTQGAAEVLVPLLRLVRERWPGVPIFLGGDFNMTKVQSADKRDKRAGGAHFVPGAYGVLVGDHAKNRKSLDQGGLRALLATLSDDVAYHSPGRAADSSDEGDEDDAALPTPAIDMWELARSAKQSFANGCKASTCHNWFGLSDAYQHVQAMTQGPGANSIDVFDDDGNFRHAATTKGKVGKHLKLLGSARFIDWLLVDRESLRKGCVRVCAATVHTATGTADPRQMMAGARNGYGSDHFPISVDLEFART